MSCYGSLIKWIGLGFMGEQVLKASMLQFMPLLGSHSVSSEEHSSPNLPNLSASSTKNYIQVEFKK